MDLLILLDLVPFNRASLQHRCRLARTTAHGTEERWLTIPYRHVGEPQQIRVVEPVDIVWPRRHRAQIREWYPQAGWTKGGRGARIADWFYANTPVTEDATLSVALYAWRSMEALTNVCEMTLPPILPASALRPPEGGWGQKSDLVLNLCQAVRATTYLAGVRGAQYLDYPAFERAGISIEVQSFTHAAPHPGRSQVELSALHHFLAEGPDAVRARVRKGGGL